GLSTVQTEGKRLFLLVQNLLGVLFLLPNLREHVSHLFDDRGHDLGEERADLSVEVLSAVSSTTSQDSAHNVAASYVVGHSAVRDGECTCAHVVGNDAVR